MMVTLIKADGMRRQESGKFLGGLIQSIHNVVHCIYRLDHVVERLVAGLRGEDDEHARLLVQDPQELLVEDHLAQLLLHLVLGKANLGGHVVDLYLGVRLNDSAQILLQHVLKKKSTIRHKQSFLHTLETIKNFGFNQHFTIGPSGN